MGITCFKNDQVSHEERFKSRIPHIGLSDFVHGFGEQVPNQQTGYECFEYHVYNIFIIWVVDNILVLVLDAGAG